MQVRYLPIPLYQKTEQNKEPKENLPVAVGSLNGRGLISHWCAWHPSIPLGLGLVMNDTADCGAKISHIAIGIGGTG